MALIIHSTDTELQIGLKKLKIDLPYDPGISLLGT
jgi:hypothetical protein